MVYRIIPLPIFRNTSIYSPLNCLRTRCASVVRTLSGSRLMSESVTHVYRGIVQWRPLTAAYYTSHADTTIPFFLGGKRT